MKNRRIIIQFLCIALFASMLSGCGKSDTQTGEQSEIFEAETETLTDDLEIESESPVIEEPVSDDKQIYSHLLIITSAGEDGSYQAYDSDGKAYILSLADSFPEEDREALTEMTVVETTSFEMKGQEDGETTILTIETADSAEESQETLDLQKKAFEWINGFSVDTSITGSLYAKQSVNVRKGPSTDYEKLGGLGFAEEVTVTGMADNGWYQINFQGGTGYVSNNYIVTEKPVATVASSTGGSSSGGTSESAGTSSSGGEDFYAVYSEAEMDAALNSGDMQTFFNMLNANASVSMPDGGGNSSGQAASAVSEKSISLSTEFVDYMNTKRAEQGLDALSWSDSMGATAMERAEEIVSNFSHDGSRNCSAENIAKTSNGSVSGWYESFYNSTVHRYAMLDKAYKSAAAAVCQVGNTYYVAVLFGY